MTRPFHSVLVANRGEIAVRVFRTARAMGYRCVAVFSEVDATSPHVTMADEAVCIGAAPSAASYLRADAILEAAARTGADAIHPGYGFLSEDAAFAQACVDAGLVWIGPPPTAIAEMGDKARAKQLMERAGVPTVPGSQGAHGSDAALRVEAERLGVPLLVKAVGGGGGRGMRLVRDLAELDSALAGARREASAAFGTDTLMLETFIDHARHVEIQVFADTHGSVVHLAERDCTTQRRRQKVIEEAPSPVLSSEQRAQMGADAVQAARAIGYVGAGTVEMILAADGRHYFLEMNTRLQVEHPVTELVTGIDLVEWQLRVAAGEPLPHPHDIVELEGHAIQARLYAEDPANAFAPQVGPIRWFRPHDQSVDGVRIDAGIEEGGAVTPFYDPMVAKVLAQGRTRDEAARKLARALEMLPLVGVRTNRDFLIRLLRTRTFLEAEITTHTLDEWVTVDHPVLQDVPPDPRAWALAASLLAGAPDPSFRSTGAASLTLRLTDPSEVTLAVSHDGQGHHVVGPGVDLDLEILSWHDGVVRYEHDGVRRRAFAVAHDGVLSLDDGAGLHRFVEASAAPERRVAADPRKITSHVAGTVVAVHVAAGDPVDVGTTVAIVEAMKMETRLVAEAAGTVASVHATVGDQIEANSVVVDLDLDLEGDV